MGPSNSSYLSNIAIFHFHDYGGKSACRKTNIPKMMGSEVGKCIFSFQIWLFWASNLKVPGRKTSDIKKLRMFKDKQRHNPSKNGDSVTILVS